ncbi:hypothetical protein [Nocardia sp. NPDC004604]|uniref:hypothetical protein n=1 Tax=Nocardia sp. NPDC004604 TaxID=3157013 RepID=UPI0033AFEAE0
MQLVEETSYARRRPACNDQLLGPLDLRDVAIVVNSGLRLDRVPCETQPRRVETVLRKGLKRFAYLLPSRAGFRPGDRDAATFVTDYFDDPDRARAWLQEG